MARPIMGSGVPENQLRRGENREKTKLCKEKMR